jgi:hypothetical protein
MEGDQRAAPGAALDGCALRLAHRALLGAHEALALVTRERDAAVAALAAERRVSDVLRGIIRATMRGRG